MRTHTILLSILAIIVLPAQAEARHHRPAQYSVRPTLDVAAISAYPIEHGAKRHSGRQVRQDRSERYRMPQYRRSPGFGVPAASYEETIIGRRPDGCPHAYCGCGLRKYLGLADVRLNLAWNWAVLFPREPAPRAGLAAVRHGHVMYIEAPAANGEWLIRDYNSGGGMSRLHVRDVRGYVFVNPGGRMAMK